MHIARVQKLFRETRSVTAVEFAMIGPVLFLFLFLILMLGVVQFWQLTLDDAVRNAARQVSLGAAGATAGIQTGAQFVTTVCNEFGQAAPNCSTLLQYSVKQAPSFTYGITPATLSATGALSPSSAFPTLAVSEPVLVQAAYTVPFSIPLVPMKLITLDGTPSIVSAVAIVTEP